MHPPWSESPWERLRRRREDWQSRRERHRTPAFHQARRAMRRSLRVRLTWAFVAVSGLSAWVALGSSGVAPAWHRSGFGFALALAAAAGFGAWTANLITGRLSRLTHAAETINLRDLQARVPVEGQDEVAALARAFNRMLDRLAAEERVRRDLFADVAHELRHPLAVLRARLESMQDGVVPIDGEQVLHLQDMVIALARLVGDVRDLSLADIGQLSLTLADVDVAALLAELRDNLEPLAQADGVELTADIAVDLPHIQGDADRIRQVVVNLLSNALQHTPRGGSVAVRARATGQYVAIEVIDTGVGIQPNSLRKVFDRFYRADPSRTRDGAAGGTGLGLAIVRGLVEAHGGAVWAASRPGQGSTFIVRLPARGPRRSSTHGPSGLC